MYISFSDPVVNANTEALLAQLALSAHSSFSKARSEKACLIHSCSACRLAPSDYAPLWSNTCEILCRNDHSACYSR